MLTAFYADNLTVNLSHRIFRRFQFSFSAFQRLFQCLQFRVLRCKYFAYAFIYLGQLFAVFFFLLGE